MPSVRELLVEIDVALEDYTLTIASARNPSLSAAEQRQYIDRARRLWGSLRAAHEELVQYSVANGSRSLRLVQNQVDRPADPQLRSSP